MTVTRNLSALAVAIALSATAADAQNINFTSRGAFSGTGCASSDLQATYASCTSSGGIELRYTFGTQQVFLNEGTGQFGTFATSGTGLSSFADVLFRLTIDQTSPTVGSSMLSANIMGSVDEINGGLIWGPLVPTTFSIGVVNYTISTDANTNGVRIGAPGVGGAPSDPQSIRGFVTTTPLVTVPEPGTLALLLVGVAGISLATTRRRAS